jgi:hypothetical protein
MHANIVQVLVIKLEQQLKVDARAVEVVHVMGQLHDAEQNNLRTYRKLV